MRFVLLHGLGSDRRQPLDLFGPVLAARPGRVIAPDVRAHGASTVIGGPDDFVLDRLADEVASAVRDASAGDDDEPVTVLGISMGAAIALRICLRGLLPVEQAVFVRPAFGPEPLPPNLRAFPVIGQLLADLGPVDGAARFRRTLAYVDVARRSPAGGAGLLAQFEAPDAAARAVRLVEIPRNRAFRDDAELAGVAGRGIRSAVIAAERDPVHPVELAERWASGLGAPLDVVPPRDDGQVAQTAALRAAVARRLDAA